MANFPTSVSTNANLYIAVNGLQTTLAVAVNNSITTLTLTSTTGFPTTGLVTIDNTEIVSYTGISGADLTGCTRGADGTTAASHPMGVTVGATIVAAHHNLLKDEVIAIETALGAGYTTTLPESGGTMTGDITMNNAKSVIFKETTANGTDSITLRAPDSVTTSYTLKLPPVVGASGTVLTDAAGDGVLSWVAAGTGTVTSVSGTTNQITSTGGATPVLAIADPVTLPQIVGTTTNDNAAAGHIGEYIVSTSGTVNSTTGTYVNITSINLTAGDWDVVGQIDVTINTGVNLTLAVGVVSLFSGNTTTDHVEPLNAVVFAVPVAAIGGESNCSICYRVSISGNQTVYLKHRIDFTSGQPQSIGTIRARRMR